MSKIRHRHVIQCFGACTVPPNFCLVMELAARSLKQAIYDPATSMDPPLVIDWASQIASGINYLHTEAPVTIVHRDLKPGNVLITAAGVLKVSDFGLSRARQANMTDKMSSVGTFEYMAPEVIRSEPYNEKVDVYSFGVLMWEMLTRKLPYAGLPPLSVAFGVGSGTLNLPFPSTCPVSMTAVISKCLAKDYKRRPTFKDLLSSMGLLWHSDFTSVNQQDYARLQKNWQAELGVVFESFKKEVDALKKKQAELSIAELSLGERERKVAERELLLTNANYQFVCRQTLRKITDDTIGLGLSVVRNDESNYISKIEVAAEYLSATAFFDLNIRHSMNHELHFQYFLPLYLTRRHFEAAKNMLEDAIFCAVMGKAQVKEQRSPQDRRHPPSARSFSTHFHSATNLAIPSASRTRSKSVESSKQKSPSRLRRRSSSDFEYNSFHPDMALMILSILMNEVLANAISEKMHPFKALETYCAFHRLLLSFAERYPATIETCDRQITSFMSSERDRHETEFPNLGEFLILFTISTVPWSKGADAFVDEVMQRSWRWIIKAYPELGRMKISRTDPLLPVEIEGVKDEDLVEKVFQSSLHAIRVTLLHVHFLHYIAHSGGLSLTQLASLYDDTLGQPSAKMTRKAEGSFKDVFAVATFADFLVKVGYSPVPLSPSQISLMLRKAAARSHAKKYFVLPRPKSEVEDFVVL